MHGFRQLLDPSFVQALSCFQIAHNTPTISQAAQSNTSEKVLPAHEGWYQHAEQASCLVERP